MLLSDLGLTSKGNFGYWLTKGVPARHAMRMSELYQIPLKSFDLST